MDADNRRLKAETIKRLLLLGEYFLDFISAKRDKLARYCLKPRNITL